MLQKLVSGLVFVALLATPARAAFLEVQGSASVDKGYGYAAATNNMAVSPGDRVRALRGCTLIIYENGYQSKLCSGQMALVLADPPRMTANGSLKDAPVAEVAPFPVGGLLVAGGIITGVIIEKHEPASP
jgi:hypothetical protein